MEHIRNIGALAALKAAMFTEARNAFHAHLDKCSQCRDNPMELCAEGGRLLLDTGRAMGLGLGMEAHLRMMGLDALTGKPPKAGNE